MSLGVSLTIQSVSAPAQLPGTIIGPASNDPCQGVPDCVKIVKWCEITPEKCLELKKIPDEMFKIPPFPPGCPHCEKVILTLKPNEFLVVGQLKNNTYALQVSPQDVLKMLGNVTSMTNSSMTAK